MEIFTKTYEYKLREDQFVFIDNGIDSDADAEEKEQSKYNEALETIKEFTYKVKPFFCQDIKEVLKENEELKKQMDTLIEEKDLEKEEYIKEYEKKLED